MNYPMYPPEISQSTAGRLFELIGTRLAIPVTPLPGEGLADLLFRAGVLNGWANLGRELFVRYKRPLSHHALTWAPFDLDYLSDVLGTPNGKADLEPIAYELNGDAVIPSGSCNFFGAVLPKKQLLDYRRTSTLALRKASVSRAIWHINALNFDPESHELLLDHCPVCSCVLEFRNAVSMYHCSHCEPAVDFRDFPQPIVEFEDKPAIRFVTCLIDPLYPDKRQILSQLHSELSSHNPGNLFMLCVMIALVLDDRVRLNDAGRKYPITGAAVTPGNLESAGRALLDWPIGLSKLRERIESSSLFESKYGIRHPFKELLRSTKLFDQSLIVTIPSALSTPRFHIPNSSAKDDTLLSTEGAIDRNTPFRKKAFKLICSFTRDSGMPYGIVRDYLTSNGTPLDEPSFEVDSIGLEQLKQLRAAFENLPCNRSGSVSVQSIVSAICIAVGNPWPPIFDAIASRKILLSAVPGSGNWISRLRVDHPEQLVEFCLLLKPYLGTVNVGIGYADVALHLNSTTSSIATRLTSYLGHEAGRTLKHLAAFRAKYISVGEIKTHSIIANRMQSQVKIATELQRQGVVPISRGFYSRDAVVHIYGA